MSSPLALSIHQEDASAAGERLRGPALLWARIGFVVLFVVVVALNGVTLPGVLLAQVPPDIAQYLRHFSPFSVVVTAVATLFSYGDALVFLGMGLLLFWRRSDDRLALACAVMLVTFGGVAATPLDDVVGGFIPAPVSSFPLLVALVRVLVVIGQVSLVAFFFIFPSGRFVPRWTLWCVPAVVAFWVAALLLPGLANGPLGILLIVFFVIAAIAQVYRYQRVSTPVEREQTKWVVFGFFLAVAIIAVPQVFLPLLPVSLQQAFQDNEIVQEIIGVRWEIALALVPIGIAVAVMRSRLWAIDTVINRTLVYGSLTSILAAVYFGGVIGAQALGQALTGDRSLPPIAVVASTLLIAALFTPLRRWIQAFIDQRFYRRKYDAAKTLAAFSASLRSELDLAQLNEHLVTVVHETMQPAHVSLWLRDPDQPVAHRE